MICFLGILEGHLLLASTSEGFASLQSWLPFCTNIQQDRQIFPVPVQLPIKRTTELKLNGKGPLESPNPAPA